MASKYVCGAGINDAIGIHSVFRRFPIDFPIIRGNSTSRKQIPQFINHCFIVVWFCRPQWNLDQRSVFFLL